MKWTLRNQTRTMEAAKKRKQGKTCFAIWLDEVHLGWPTAQGFFEETLALQPYLVGTVFQPLGKDPPHPHPPPPHFGAPVSVSGFSEKDWALRSIQGGYGACPI